MPTYTVCLPTPLSHKYLLFSDRFSEHLQSFCDRCPLPNPGTNKHVLLVVIELKNSPTADQTMDNLQTLKKVKTVIVVKVKFELCRKILNWLSSIRLLGGRALFHAASRTVRTFLIRPICYTHHRQFVRALTLSQTLSHFSDFGPTQTTFNQNRKLFDLDAGLQLDKYQAEDFTN